MRIIFLLIFAGCATSAEERIQSAVAGPDRKVVCGTVRIDSSLVVSGSAEVKYISLPEDTPLELLTPELIQVLDQTICP